MSHSENYTDTGHTTAFYQGRDAERERIIKLLESVRTYPSGWDYNDPIQSVIDLIKGEQK